MIEPHVEVACCFLIWQLYIFSHPLLFHAFLVGFLIFEYLHSKVQNTAHARAHTYRHFHFNLQTFKCRRPLPALVAACLDKELARPHRSAMSQCCTCSQARSRKNKVTLVPLFECFHFLSESPIAAKSSQQAEGSLSPLSCF